MAGTKGVDQAYLAAEAKARIEIDRQLAACGWLVQDRAELNLYAGQGVAVREGLVRLLVDEGHEVIASGGTRSAWSRRSSASGPTCASSTCGCRRRSPTRACAARSRSIRAGRARRCSCSRSACSSPRAPSRRTSIFQKLRLEPAETDHRRVLAVLRYLEER